MELQEMKKECYSTSSCSAFSRNTRTHKVRHLGCCDEFNDYKLKIVNRIGRLVG